MSDQYFHGVKVIEITDGPRAVRTLASSVIGLVGTAPDAQGVATAALVQGTVAANNGITYTAAATGQAGNNVSLTIRTPGGTNQPLTILVSSKSISVLLATGSVAGVSTTTAAQLIAALAANTAVTALLTCAATGASTGVGLVANLAQTYLAGGQDAVAPLNTPVLVSSGADIGKFGTDGTLPQALADIFDQAEASIIVVRVAEGVDDAATLANVIGGSNGTTYTGLKALLGAEGATGLIPRIIIATGFSDKIAVAQEMLVEAAALKAVAVIDGPNTSDAAAYAYSQNFGSARAYLVDPGVKIYDTLTRTTIDAPASARVAGLIAKNDTERGFWWSPSNQELLNILGTSRPVDFSFNDPNSRANYLNSLGIATLIRQGGFRLWGDRTLSADPAFAFLSVRRTADIIEDSVQRAHLWAVDRNITKAYFQEVIASVQGYLDSLKALGAILDGSINANKDLNTPTNLAAGKVYFDISFTPPAPAEQVTFRVNPTSTTGYANILQ